jgi:hypothetical protein
LETKKEKEKIGCRLTRRGALCKNHPSTYESGVLEAATCAYNAHTHQQLSVCSQQNGEQGTPISYRLDRSRVLAFRLRPYLESQPICIRLCTDELVLPWHHTTAHTLCHPRALSPYPASSAETTKRTCISRFTKLKRPDCKWL